jgi:hypothetical protein
VSLRLQPLLERFSPSRRGWGLTTTDLTLGRLLELFNNTYAVVSIFQVGGGRPAAILEEARAGSLESGFFGLSTSSRPSCH